MKSKLLASLLGFGMLMCAGNAFAGPECIGDVCGYNCMQYNGYTKCSRTPQGACLGYNGYLVCWDPEVRTWEQAECKGYNGDIACGYDCVGYNGQVACAQTPQGACAGYNGNVVCWDPPVRTHKKAECITYNGYIACGFGCAYGNGQAKCSESPDGFCRYDNGTVKCWEP